MTAIILANQIRSLKFDLDEVISNHENAKMRFFICPQNHRFPESSTQWFPLGFTPPNFTSETDNKLLEEWYENITAEVDGIRTSYLAPALHLNNYLEWLAIDIEWDEIKYDLEEDAPRPSNILRRLSVDAYATSVLLSVKSGLDRLVRVLWFYYSGIAKHTTWGRFDKKGKPSGFMAVVTRNLSNDPLLADLNAAYSKWIKKAVSPRDLLIHYQDSTSLWYFFSKESTLIQSHVIEDSENQVHEYGITELTSYVNEWYKLADSVLLTLATRLPLKFR